MEATGEIMCRVEVPAKYKTVERKVLIEPERVVEETIPARYETITKRVLVREATVERREIPAVYDKRTVRVMVEPERSVQELVPAEFETITKREQISTERLEWREILCETNTTPGVIRRLQTALNNRGYDAGTVDGKIGRRTLNAVDMFQSQNDLPQGGLTLATLKALGVSL